MSKTFSVRSYKGIVDEISITSGTGLLVLAGDNKQGKSSFLDAVREVLRFAGARETPEPIHQGESEAVVEIIDHERERRYVRTFKRTAAGKITSEVAVYALDGAKYGNPAEILAQDIGAEIIDAGEFARMSAKDQRDTLLRQIELPFDLDEIAREKAGAEERRREAGREVTRLKGALDSMPKPATDVPDEEVSASAILDEIRAAQDAQFAREGAERSNNEAAAAVNQLEREILALQEQLGMAKVRKEAAFKRLSELPEAVDVAPLQAQLESVEATNAAVRSARDYLKVAHELAVSATAQDSAQTVLNEIDERKRAGLAAASFPDPMLSFDDAGVLYDGVPFQQLNDADKRIVGARILVGASDRALRIGFLREGDLLDDENLERLRQVAIDSDYTFIVERGRDSSKDIGYLFHEGALAEAVAS